MYLFLTKIYICPKNKKFFYLLKKNVRKEDLFILYVEPEDVRMGFEDSKVVHAEIPLDSQQKKI